MSVIKENNQLRSIVASLYSESKQKIEQSSAVIKELTKQRDEAVSDATSFAQMLY